MAKLHIEMLGALQVRVGEEIVDFRTDAQRVLLAYLAVHQARPQRRDTLAGLLSPDRPDKEALTYLRNRLTRLRRAVGDNNATPPWFETDRKQIALRTGADIFVDVVRFEACMATVGTHAHRQLAGCPTCLAQLQEAVDLVRGELLAGLNFPSDTWEGWLLTQREYYQQRGLAGMTQLLEARLARGEWAEVLELAQRQLGMEPWLEGAHRAIMQAHVYLGDRNAALAQYEQCELLLWDELGVKPDAETTSLFERLKAQDGELPSSVLRLPSSVPDNLPLQTTRFFGREAEQAQLLERLVDPAYRLVTLVGTGGIGKTRLAIEVGQRVKMSFPEGVWFVPLDGVRGGMEQIKIGVGEALGLGQVGKQLTGEQVLAILRDKRVLLIFDNCESLLDEIAFIPGWLRRAPGVAILATSRERLNFQAEVVVGLRGLGEVGEVGVVPGRGKPNPAQALFTERAQMARADFTLTDENLPLVRQICQLVDGSPLGISLAAAWVRRRSLEQIIDEMGRSLDILSTRMRDIDPRHRSMRAVFETSWQLLMPEEQKILAALSVFPTTFTAGAAEGVTGATLFDLDVLCEKSLLQQEVESERYLLHSLVRQFSASKLMGETERFNRAFVDYFYAYAETHQERYERLRPEWLNFSEGIARAHGLGAWQRVLDFVQVLDTPWFRQIRFEGMRRGLRLAVDAAGALQDETALARTLLRLGEVEIELNDYAMAESHLTQAMVWLLRVEDGSGIAQAKYLEGRIKSEQARDAEALPLIREAKRIFEDEADWTNVAKSLNHMALCHMKQNPDFKMAERYLLESVTIQRELPASATYVEALRYLARINGIFEAYETAEKWLMEAVKVSQAQQDMGEYAAVLFERVVLCRRQNQFDVALRYGQECLDLFQKLGSLRWEGLVKMQLGILQKGKGNFAEAVSLFGDCRQLFGEVGDLYEQAYACYFLYVLYGEVGEVAQSLLAKQEALRLNAVLHDPELARRLAE